jgi:hypothetical protein
MLNLKITIILEGIVLKKKTFNEAKKNLNVSNNFQFYYKKINLGDIALEQREFKDALHYFQK